MVPVGPLRASSAASTPEPASGTPNSLQPHLHTREGAHQREIVEVAEMADAEHAALELAEPLAEGHVEPAEDQLAKPVGIQPGRQPHAGKDLGMLRRHAALGLEAPGPDGRPGRGTEAGVAREDGVQPFLAQHGQSLREAMDQVGRGRVGKEAGAIGRQHRRPIPVGARQPRGLLRRQRLGRDRVEAQAGRQHQALLRAGDGHVHAPLVVPVVDRAQGRDRVDHQQGRVACPVDGPADRLDLAGDAGRGLVVDDADGLDLVRPVGGKPLGDDVRIRPRAPVAGQEFRCQTETARQIVPQRREMPGLVHQEPVARRRGVDQRRLPGARARGGEDDDGPLGLEHGLESVQHLAAEPLEVGAAMIDRGLGDGMQDALGHVGRPRDLQEMAAGWLAGHPRSPWGESSLCILYAKAVPRDQSNLACSAVADAGRNRH